MVESEKGETDTEFTRSMKHLLIRELLRHGLLVFEVIGSKRGVDLVIADWVDGKFKSIGISVRTCSLTLSGGSWRYTMTVPSRSQYPEDSEFIYGLVFEEEDELRPSFYVLNSIHLKKFIESKLKKRESWRGDEPYTFHITREELNKDLAKYKGFNMIDKLLGRQKPKPYVRSSEEYWKKHKQHHTKKEGALKGQDDR